MKPAAFEEREFEGPLYNQLGNGRALVWAPGQVFEGHIGIDHALFLTDEWVFRLHRHAGYLPGAVLARYGWPSIWFRPGRRNRLPTFRLNLFVQAKRPSWGRRAPKALRQYGISGLFWRFDINPDQQQALEFVAEKLGKRALVVYAAPAFHDHRSLFRHTRVGTLVENSTFPSVASLKGHSAWNYSRPGASGVANADPEQIEEPILLDRIAAMLQTDAADGGWRQELKKLAADIREGLNSSELGETSRRAAFSDLIRGIARDVGDMDNGEVIVAYLSVLAFCEVFALDWYVVGAR